MQSQLEKAGIQWDLHLFADTVNTEASDIAKIIQNTAQKVQAELVVLAHHNEVCHAFISEPLHILRAFADILSNTCCRSSKATLVQALLLKYVKTCPFLWQSYPELSSRHFAALIQHITNSML